MTNAKTVFGNAGALTAIQIANQILPFILVPYLTRTLGFETYGVVAYGLGIVQLACVLTDYGFNLSATQHISTHRDDPQQLSRYVGAVLTCKAALFLFVAMIIGAYALLTDKYAQHITFLMLLILPVAGQTFQPLWFFQGMERMALITAYTVTARLLYFVLVLLWVDTPADAAWVALAAGVSQIVSGLMGQYLMLRQGCRPRWPGVAAVREAMHSSTEFFWSRAAVSTYTAGGSVFLGLVSNSNQVALYAAAEQLYRGAQSLLTPLSQALYPNMVRTRNFELLFRILRWSTAACIASVPLGIWLAEPVLGLLYGQDFVEGKNVLLIFLIILTINTPSVLLGYPLLGALGRTTLANRSVVLAGALQVALLLVCWALDYQQAITVAAIVLLVESLVLVLRTRWGLHELAMWRIQTESK